MLKIWSFDDPRVHFLAILLYFLCESSKYEKIKSKLGRFPIDYRV